MVIVGGKKFVGCKFGDGLRVRKKSIKCLSVEVVRCIFGEVFFDIFLNYF